MDMGMMGGFGWIGMIINIVVIVGIVILVVWAVKHFTGTTNNFNQSPRDILQARYARGEITREQYQQMLSDLS